MSENTTFDFLTIENLGLNSPSSQYPAFIFAILLYTLILTFNSMVLFSIVFSKKLHKPMFLVFSIITKNRIITYDTCMFQAFLIHFYGTANLLVLSAMSYDRYVAICRPLSYNAVMTSQLLVKLIFMIWFSNVAIMGTLIALNLRLNICRTNIVDLYCNNPSLVKLACGDTTVNNYYMQILRLCVMSKQVEARRKAAQTCGSHLVMFLILQINTIITLSAHRIKDASPYLRRSMGVSVLVFPPFLDPIIYGLSSRELKMAFLVLIRRNVAVK